MKRLLLIAPLAVATMVSRPAGAQKEARPTSLSDHARILFENDRVRVTEFDAKPGTRIGMRAEPDHVLYALKGCEYQSTTADGKTLDVELKQGKAHWDRGSEQSTQIIGDRSCHYIDVQLKEPSSEIRR